MWLLDLDSGDERLLGSGYSVADGPEFSPDGHSVYFNSEVASAIEGHAQLFCHDLRDGSVEQLTSDERVNWFPHPRPMDAGWSTSAIRPAQWATRPTFPSSCA